jgi:hypothetical protein
MEREARPVLAGRGKRTNCNSARLSSCRMPAIIRNGMQSVQVRIMSRVWLYGLTAALCILVLGGALFLNFRQSYGQDRRAVFGTDQVDMCREVQAALQAEKFDELDRMGRQLATLKDRFVGGREKIAGFYDFTGMDGCTTGFCDAQPVQPENIRKLQHWLNRDPRNPVAKTAMALNWYHYAWISRSCAAFGDITFDQWQGYFDRLRIARSYLADIDPRESPQYYVLMILITCESGGPREQLDALYEQGHAAFPDFYSLTAIYSWSLDLSWFGRKGDVAWLSGRLLTDPGGDAGQVAYSFIAEQAARTVSTDRYFSDTGLSWEKIKQGFATRQRLYDLSNHDWNAYGYIAYAASDRNAAREAYAHFGDNWDDSVWGQGFYLSQVLPWIKG